MSIHPLRPRCSPALSASVLLVLVACADERTASGETGLGNLSEAGESEGPPGVDSGAHTPRLDVGEGHEGGGDDGSSATCVGSGESPEVDFSYIWIANSGNSDLLVGDKGYKGTVSKVDTFTGIEVARYASGPDETSEVLGPDYVLQRYPSRTSVNLYGDAAVSNRGRWDQGSVTKFAARKEDCIDRNGNGRIDTSSGPEDVLPWGEDECMLWNVEIPTPSYEQGPRPTAWQHHVDDDGCVEKNPPLWVGWYVKARNEGVFRLLDGATGDTIEEVIVRDWSGAPDTGGQFGPYGGAVNADNDLWSVGLSALGATMPPLTRIDAGTLEVERVPYPEGRGAYGMAIDGRGRVWSTSGTSLVAYDPSSSSWVDIDTNDPHNSSLYNRSVRGIAVDRDGIAFAAISYDSRGRCGIVIVDTNADELMARNIEIEGCKEPVGVAVDFEGYWWVVDRIADGAFKLDPDTWDPVLRVDDLVAPYTYSDMTGAGLNLVANPPPAG